MITASTSCDGGAIFCEFADPTINSCLISGNGAEDRGGAIHCHGSSPTITNCTITNNVAYAGGGVYCTQESNPTIGNCTISGNTTSSGGGVYCLYSSPEISNSILWANRPEQIYVYWSEPAVTYCDVDGGWPGEGNIDADPLFVDPDGPDDDPKTWGDNDYHLSPGSGCIDAGDPAFVPGPDERDIDGQMRVWDGDDDGQWVVDMGSDEFGSHAPGDLNGDGCVDHADLGILLSDWGCTGGDCPGDADGDGDTDHADLGILLGHWGEGCP